MEKSYNYSLNDLKPILWNRIHYMYFGRTKRTQSIKGAHTFLEVNWDQWIFGFIYELARKKEISNILVICLTKNQVRYYTEKFIKENKLRFKLIQLPKSIKKSLEN